MQMEHNLDNNIIYDTSVTSSYRIVKCWDSFLKCFINCYVGSIEFTMNYTFIGCFINIICCECHEFTWCRLLSMIISIIIYIIIITIISNYQQIVKLIN
jgi:hypothetical protein